MGILLLMILLSFLPGLLGEAGVYILFVGFLILTGIGLARVNRRLNQNSREDNLMLAAGLYVVGHGMHGHAGGNSH